MSALWVSHAPTNGQAPAIPIFGFPLTQALYALTTTRYSNAHEERRGFRCVPRPYPRVGAQAHFNFFTQAYAHALLRTTTKVVMVKRAGWKCQETTYCTRASRGLSAIAEFLVLFDDDTKCLTTHTARNKHSTSFSCKFFSLLNLCTRNHKQSMIVNVRIHNSASVLCKG